MLVIKGTQIEVFKKASREEFIIKSIDFLNINLPHWVRGQEEKELRIFINEVIDFGEKYHIYKEVSLQKLMYIQIKYDYMGKEPFPERIITTLSMADLEEHFRVKFLLEQLIKQNKKFEDARE